MLPKNLAIIVVVAVLSTFCHVKARQTRSALFVADAMALIDDYYVDPVDSMDLLTAAMKGMTDMLDEHSTYIPGKAYETFQDSINQEFAGIGILVEQPEKDEPVRVITPLVGSPALAAGLMPGDEIVRVDDEDVSAMDIEAVSARLKGPIATTVRIVVNRDGEEIAIEIKRATIALESVIGDHRDESNKWVYRLQDEPTIAYIRLTSFGEKTVEELRDVLTRLDNDFQGLALDLRGNGGGLLYSAVEICDMFLDSGKIVSTRTRGGNISEAFSAESGTLVASSKPLAVLIDGDSASASEIVAACLQDNGRAVVVGVRSYGKGTVQEILPLQFGHSALRLTIARYYRPSDKNIHRLEGATEDDDWGVKPDSGFEVSLDEATLDKLVRRWREASYPLLAGIEKDAPKPVAEEPVGDATDAEHPPTVDVDPSPETAKASAELPSGLLIDPQLRRAVEYLRQAVKAAIAA